MHEHQSKIGTLRWFYLKIVVLCILCPCALQAQEVEHNYLMAPQKTNCDSLRLVPGTGQDLVQKVRSTRFRYDQHFRLTRRQGLQAGEFYSCDNIHGFLVIKYDGKLSLYGDALKEKWDQMLHSSDPEGYFLSWKKHLSLLQAEQ